MGSGGINAFLAEAGWAPRTNRSSSSVIAKCQSAGRLVPVPKDLLHAREHLSGERLSGDVWFVDANVAQAVWRCVEEGGPEVLAGLVQQWYETEAKLKRAQVALADAAERHERAAKDYKPLKEEMAAAVSLGGTNVGKAFSRALRLGMYLAPLVLAHQALTTVLPSMATVAFVGGGLVWAGFMAQYEIRRRVDDRDRIFEPSQKSLRRRARRAALSDDIGMNLLDKVKRAIQWITVTGFSPHMATVEVLLRSGTRLAVENVYRKGFVNARDAFYESKQEREECAKEVSRLQASLKETQLLGMSMESNFRALQSHLPEYAKGEANLGAGGVTLDGLHGSMTRRHPTLDATGHAGPDMEMFFPRTTSGHP